MSSGSKAILTMECCDDGQEAYEGIMWKDRMKGRTRLRVWSIVNIFTSIGLIIMFAHQVWRPAFSINASLRQLSSYSPVLETVEIPVYESQIDGGLAAYTNESIARLPPGHKSDMAWHRFEDIRYVVITRADVVAMGKDPDTAARFIDEEWGFGHDAFMGTLDVVHQLHCLDQLRKAAFATYHDPFAEAKVHKRSTQKWVHLQHCLSILLENLMCHADTEVITMNWNEEDNHPFPDFSVRRQCRDFETVMAWQAARAVNKEKWNSMTKPTNGTRIIAGEKEWFSLPE